MVIEETTLPGALVIMPRRFADHRGHFSETYNAQALRDAGIETVFVQDNQSFSTRAGTVRGLHFQSPPHAQAKLVRVLRGSILDVIVDIRIGSPTYGQHTGVELSAGNGRQLLVPVGFLHGFVTREPETEVFYKCSAFYAPAHEGSVRYDDPDLGIDWGLDSDGVTIAAKDAAAPLLKDVQNPFIWKTGS